MIYTYIFHKRWLERDFTQVSLFQFLYFPVLTLFIPNTSEAFNTLRPRQNGRHFADDIFKRIFVNENILIPIKISLKFDPRGSINNIPALVQIMAWCRPGDKPLSELMMVNLLTHICVSRPQWVNSGIVLTCNHQLLIGKIFALLLMS